MNYLASITDFFKSPKWVTNLLLAAVCCLIPVVGPMVVLGWLITGFWGRQDESPVTFPDFDFGKFVAWLQRGLWPVLVSIVAVIAMYMVFLIPMILVGFVLGGNSNHEGSGMLGALAGLVMLGMEFVMLLAMVFVLKPLMLKAIFEQDFVKAFDFAFVKRFVSLVWLEMLIAAIFIMVASFVLGLAGLIALCIGVLAVPPILYFAIMHLDKQLYQLYLSRGGAPMMMSPKLSDSPPPAPPAPPAAPAA